MPGLSRDDRPDFLHAVSTVCATVNNAGWSVHGDDRIDNQIQQLISDLPSVAFGLETAVRDLRTGGRQRLWDTPFTHGVAGLATHGLVWMDTVDHMLAQIQAKIAAGFRVIKMKVGALPFAEELSLLRTVRNTFAAAQLELRLDANGAFQPETALEKLNQLAPLGDCIPRAADPGRTVAGTG